MAKSDRQSGARFPTTHWSLVDRVGGDDQRQASDALNDLLKLYLPALNTYLTQIKRVHADRADDILQSFTAEKILEKGLISSADCERGRFRTLLLTALDRFVVSQVRSESAKKRGGGKVRNADPEDFDRAARSPAAGNCAFEIAWAQQVLSETIRRVEAECRSSGRAEMWAIFEQRVLGPTLDGRPAPGYSEVIEQIGLKSPSQASNALITAKRIFQRVLRSVVSEYAGTSEEAESEIRDLREILAKRGAGSH